MLSIIEESMNLRNSLAVYEDTEPNGIAVKIEHRGKGYGGKLIDEIPGYGKYMGLRTVRPDGLDGNENAYRMYRNKGFRDIKNTISEY